MDKKEVLKSVCKFVCEHLDLPLKEVKKNVDVPFLDYADGDGENGMLFQDFSVTLLPQRQRIKPKRIIL